MTTRLLGPADLALLLAADPELFDDPVRSDAARAFLDDPRHHLAAAIAGDRIVGFASGVDYVHPDKPRELWINEVGVLPAFQRRGLGLAVLRCLLDHGRSLGCSVAWVLTHSGNQPARQLYAALGGVATPAGADAEAVVMVSFAL